MQNDKNINPVCKDTIPPDPEILAWEKWIQIRKEETEHLAKKTGRPPVDLAMNTIEMVRENKERKIALEHAQIEKKATLRNTLWDQPERLTQKCYCEPVYEVQRTKAEIGRPRVIEHIGVPKLIQETEKGLTGTSQRNSCSQLDTKYFEYRNKRENELHNKIKKIDPYRPEISDLIIKGTKPKVVKKTSYIIPEIKISDTCAEEYAISKIYAVQINNSLFYKQLPGQDLTQLIKMQTVSGYENCSCWSYYFNTPINKIGKAKLLLKNLGTVSLRYCWKEIKMPIAFVPDIYNDQVFFFNKNEDVLYPGQEKEITFTFVSNKPDLYNESWKIYFCNVNFFDTIFENFIVNLSADATENMEITNRKTNKLMTAIKISALKIMARSIIKEMVTKAMSVEHQIYPYKHLFVEAEIFEMKNPICFYHQTEVTKLKELYMEMIPGELWDLSISSWRVAMMNIEYYDDRMKYNELLRKSHRELVKPWYESENLLDLKHKAINIILGQLADQFYDEYTCITNTFRSHKRKSENIRTRSSKLNVVKESSMELDDMAIFSIRNIFYMRMYDHVSTTIETCAGVLSSLDLNRWIYFDFCKK